ncbi:uncharacterized protein LOC124444937 isoform X2 [Xenia sp. Carnegie-2017]|nr:uncharacterized protein LOC124444937 isoform X2 [Xenia sp. Carnegie-2017]
MQRSCHFMEKKQEKVINNYVGTFNDLDNASESKEQHVKEDQMMCFELPTGKKGFIGEIGFSFGGSMFDETGDVSEWTATPILVENVTRGSIAEKAGLEPYDEIIKINGITVACAARSLPVSLIKQCDKKMRILVRKGKGRRRTENIVFSNEQMTEFYDAFSIYDRLNKRKIFVKDVLVC